MVDQWASVYNEHVRDIYQFLMYLTHNRETAKDLTQETFVKAFSKWTQFHQRSTVKTWLLAIARNLAVDWMRKHQGINRVHRLLHEPITNCSLPEELISMNEQKHALYTAIQSLKPDYRTVVILRGIQELTISEAAMILGWTESKVKVTFHRAIRALHTKLVKEGEFTYELDQ